MKRGELNKLFPDRFDFGASLRKPYGISSFNRLVRQYKANASRRGIEFRLNDAYFRALTSAQCSYCGVDPRQIMTSKDANGAYVYNGIDRVDSRIGYVSGNCVTACGLCNSAKSSMDHSAWTEWLSRLVAFHTHSRTLFKMTIEKDTEHKWERAR